MIPTDQTITTAFLAGPWRLHSWTLFQNGRPLAQPMGPDAQGQIIYAGSCMSAFLQNSDLAARPRLISYAGGWNLVGNSVRHHVEISSEPAWIGTTLERTAVRLGNDSLRLETPATVGRSGASYADHIVWSRAT